MIRPQAYLPHGRHMVTDFLCCVLFQQLAALLITRQVVGNIKEALLPYVINKIKLYKMGYKMTASMSPDTLDRHMKEMTGIDLKKIQKDAEDEERRFEEEEKQKQQDENNVQDRENNMKGVSDTIENSDEQQREKGDKQVNKELENNENGEVNSEKPEEYRKKGSEENTHECPIEDTSEETQTEDTENGEDPLTEQEIKEREKFKEDERKRKEARERLREYRKEMYIVGDDIASMELLDDAKFCVTQAVPSLSQAEVEAAMKTVSTYCCKG